MSVGRLLHKCSWQLYLQIQTRKQPKCPSIDEMDKPIVVSPFNERMDAFTLLIEVMVSLVGTHVKTYHIVCIKYVQFVTWQLYLKKAVLKV